MNTEQKLELIAQVGEEIITIEELRALLEKKKNPVAYDGFEPSGNAHIAQGILRAINVNKMTRAGCKFKMYVADWHAWANGKLGGDMEKIQTVGKYLVEVWKSTEMDLKNVEFVWATDVIKDEKYWPKVMKIATSSTLNRILRCVQIMGRKETETLSASQVFYPCMQAADIFHMGIDITQLGMDQRKVNMLARELGEKLGYWKPVAVHHHMLMGLTPPSTTTNTTTTTTTTTTLPPLPETRTSVVRSIELKMSKSIPDSAIFMTDSRGEVERKIMKAFCPEKQPAENPVIEYCKYLVFEKSGKMKIERLGKFGGDIELKSFGELENAFASGELHPMDLKKSVAFYINEMLEPTRKHFEKGKARELLEQVQGFEVTR